MEFRFTQTWTKDDYVAFATNHMIASVFKLSNLILFSVSIGYLLIYPFFTGDFRFFFMGLSIFFFLAAFLLFTRVGARRSYEKNKDLMTISFVINDEGLTYLNKEGELLKPWNEFYSFKETEKYFFIYFSKNKGMLLAKRDFDESLKRFIIEKIQEHLVDKRKIKVLKNIEQ